MVRPAVSHPSNCQRNRSAVAAAVSGCAQRHTRVSLHLQCKGQATGAGSFRDSQLYRNLVSQKAIRIAVDRGHPGGRCLRMIALSSPSHLCDNVSVTSLRPGGHFLSGNQRVTKL